jgi:hypothetical protein
MADLKVEGAELKTLVKLGKKRSLSFGFCPGAKNEHTLLIDRRKSPEMLGKLARQEGESNKVAFGTFEVKGRTMEMTCGRTVPQMAKVIKKYLKSQKISINVVIIDADGNTLESDVEDLPADPDMEDDATDAADDGEPAVEASTEVAAEDEVNPDQSSEDDSLDAASLAARLKALRPAVVDAAPEISAKLSKVMAAAVAQIKATALSDADQTITALENAVAKLTGGLQEPAASPTVDKEAEIKALAARAQALKSAIAGVPAPARDKLLAALTDAVKHIRERNLDDADALLNRLETAIGKLTEGASTASAAQDSSKWDMALSRLQPAVDKVIAEKRGDLDAINQAFNHSKKQAEAGQFDKALEAAAKVAELLKQAATATTSGAAESAVDSSQPDVDPYLQSQLAWIETRNKLRKEVEDLRSAIDAATADLPGFEDVPRKSGILLTHIDGIDANLETTLEKLVKAPDGAQREELKSSARKIIETYRGVLDTEFFKAVDDNGFIKTDIRGSALASLQKVSAALAS